MTEYTTDPEAIAHYLAARARTAHWVDSLSDKTLVAPSIPPSLVSDTDDGLSSQDSDAESSRSLPPPMLLRYPDGRPDVPVTADTRWPPQSQKPTAPTPFHTRPRAGSGSHGYPPSNPNIHSRAPSNGFPLYVSPPPPVVTMQPETIHVRPSPTSPVPHQGPASYLTSNPHHSNSLSTPSRERSMRSTPSSRRPPVSLQMIYTPPAPSSQSRSAPVSPTHESFRSAQQPPMPPPPSALYPPIAAPSPVYGFPSPTSAPEPPPPAPLTHSHSHSRSHSYSSNHSYPHPPQAAAGSAPPSAYPANSAQRQRRHSSRTGTSHGQAEVPPQSQPQAPAMGVGGGPSYASGASGSGSRRRGPPSIVYAPSANSSSYAYNPPVITNRPPQSHVMGPHDPHARTHAHRMAQSISDPTPISGSLGRNASRGRMIEHLSRTPSPNTARTRANEAVTSGLVRKERVRGSRDKSRHRDGGDNNGNGNDYNDEAASFSSGSTYYVLPSPGQKIKVVPPNTMNGLYAEPTSASASRSTPVLQSHRSQRGPYFTGSAPPPPPQPSRPQRRPLLQRIFHPQFGFGSGGGGGANDPLSASRRGFRR